jgi:RNA recognition motif-containing protein
MDRLTGRSRGFAFAEFSDSAMAADAIRRFDSLEHRGRRLRVNDADDKPPARAPRPPGAPGRPSGAPSMFRATEFSGREFPPPEVPDFPAFRKNGGSRRGLRAKKRSLR